MKLFISLGAIYGFLAVALGAFGAHILDGRIPAKYMITWEKAVLYQMFHAAGLLVVGLLAGKFGMKPLINWSGWLMFIGVILFSGSLYVLSVTQIKVLGAITPIGGVSFLVAWLLMVFAVNKYA
ncbi:DUF423 domain-containing protein [Bacillus massiliigorillae]|uniref:DUF423 domain-containing protein n=1 Tax=Bacillus massiliigorillae TaxID=1243664 RepID=UPI00039E5ABB|nr:DUF423 domain-containing protein [Bacillus massiliigorillae]